MNRGRYLLLAVLLLLPALYPQAALGHAVLLETRPAADSIAEPGLATIVLRFNEPVQPVVVRLLDAAGDEPADMNVRAVDHRVEIELPQPLAEGGYLVSWRVVSADAHPVGGSFRFAVGTWPAAWQDTEHEDRAHRNPAVWQGLMILTRTVFLLALLAAAGGVWFLVLFGRVAPALDGVLVRRAAGLALLAAIAAVLLIPLQGVRLLAPELGQLGDTAVLAELWRIGLDSTLARTAGVAALAMLVVAVILRWRRNWAATATLIGVVSLALTGHAASAEPRWLTMPVLALHACAVAFWFGALGSLLTVVHRRPAAEAAAVLQRFSRFALGIVALLVAAGITLVVVQVATPVALIATGYGGLLAGKLLLVAGVLLIAWRNRRRLTPALAAGEPNTASQLIRNIRIEIGAIAAIVLITMLMGLFTPPRALTDHHHHVHDDHHHHADHRHASTGLSASAVSRGHRAVIELTPGRVGHNELTVRFTGPQGEPVEPLEAGVRFALPERGIEPVSRPLEAGQENYRWTGSDIALPGRWRVRIDALLSEFDKAIFEVELDIPAASH